MVVSPIEDENTANKRPSNLQPWLDLFYRVLARIWSYCSSPPLWLRESWREPVVSICLITKPLGWGPCMVRGNEAVKLVLFSKPTNTGFLKLSQDLAKSVLIGKLGCFLWRLPPTENPKTEKTDACICFRCLGDREAKRELCSKILSGKQWLTNTSWKKEGRAGFLALVYCVILWLGVGPCCGCSEHFVPEVCPKSQTMRAVPGKAEPGLLKSVFKERCFGVTELAPFLPWPHRPWFPLCKNKILKHVCTKLYVAFVL